MGLQNLLEDYRNWVKTQEWKNKKQDERLFGGDPGLQEEFEKWSGGFSPSNLGGGLSGLAGAIKASHGSPHAHAKFDFSKIGTGEGAQAYGHGGYFAQGFDSPVAQEYQQALSRQAGLIPKIGNKSLIDFYNEISRKADRLPIEKAGQEYEKMAFLENLDLQPSFEDALATIDDESIIPWAKALKDKFHPAGNLYNVELKWPDAAREAADPLGEHHLLDWDAPYEQQSSSIKELLKKYYEDVTGKRSNIREGLKAKFAAQGKVAPIREEMSPVTGQQLYDQIASELNSRELASNYLSQQGVPGIRYLDQGSRVTGEGTRNYVMFDDRFPNIVSRNGVSLADLLRK